MYLVLYHEFYFKVIECPIGFVALKGVVVGDGLVPKYEATLQKCMVDCNDNIDCNSFAYSQTYKHCKLMNEVAPTMPNYSPYQEFQFCFRKSSFTGFEFEYMSGK